MELILELLKHLSLQWILAASVIFLIFDRTGFVQAWFKNRIEAQTSERELLSEDQRDLLDRLHKQIDAEREWRINDTEYYRGQIDELRTLLREREKIIAMRDETIHRLADAATLSERGNARLRHSLNNVFQYVSLLITLCRKNDVEFPAFDAWHDLLGISSDLDMYLHDLFDTVQKRGKLP